MPTLDASFPGMIAALVGRFGNPQARPEGGRDDPFAEIVREGLSRKVDARKVGEALAALREAGLLEPVPLAEADPAEVAEAGRQAGVALQAPVLRTIRRLAEWVVASHGGDVEAMESVPTDLLRDELRALNGVGPATADAILLFALRRPTYPVDRASYRILVRHGWLDPSGEYDEARDLLESSAADDLDLLIRISGWFDRVGRDACRPAVAKCERCPLRPFLPDGGPIEPEGV